MNKYAGVLIETEKGIALQQRDEKPNITNPGKLTQFGGMLEANETPLEGAIREVEEELGLKLDQKDLKKLGIYQKTIKEDGEDMECHIYFAGNISSKDLTLLEGKAIYFLHLSDGFDNPKMSRICKLALKDYLSLKR